MRNPWWPGQLASPKPAMVSEKTSIRPLGVGSGLASGSSRKARQGPPSSGACGKRRLPAAQNASKSGAGRPCSRSACSVRA
jgi:hypothetical protein